MIRWIRATFSDGVFKPQERLDLRQGQKVRIGIDTSSDEHESSRRAAMAELRRSINAMNFRSNGSYPTRDELHERG